MAFLVVGMPIDMLIDEFQEQIDAYKKAKLVSGNTQRPLDIIASLAMILQMKLVTDSDPEKVLDFMQDMKRTKQAVDFFTPTES